MSASDYATLAVAVTTVLGGLFTAIRWLVKHYLAELKPNSGSSMRDSLDRLEKSQWKQALQTCIDKFIETEQYEECSKIKALMDKIK